MMAQSRTESTRDTYNYGQYINRFPPNTIKVIREFERIHKKICRHKMSIMFNEICINEEMLPIYIYIYIYILPIPGLEHSAKELTAATRIMQSFNELSSQYRLSVEKSDTYTLKTIRLRCVCWWMCSKISDCRRISQISIPAWSISRV